MYYFFAKKIIVLVLYIHQTYSMFVSDIFVIPLTISVFGDLLLFLIQFNNSLANTNIINLFTENIIIIHFIDSSLSYKGITCLINIPVFCM